MAQTPEKVDLELSWAAALRALFAREIAQSNRDGRVVPRRLELCRVLLDGQLGDEVA
jgi:hypothetical protein